MTARPTRSDWLVLVALGLMWGTSYVFIRLGVETLSTFTLIAARLGIGFCLLVAVVAIAREPLPRDLKAYGHLVVMAVISVVLPFALITTAEQSVDSNLAAILNGTVPLFAIVFAALFLHDEPLTVNRLGGLVIGYVGVIVLFGGGMLTGSGGPSDVGAEVALVLSAVCYGAGAVYARRNLRNLRPMIPAMVEVGFAFAITATIALLAEDPFREAWTPTAILAVTWLGIFGSGLAYLANFRLIKRVGATRAALVAYLLPVVGIVAGAIVFAEPVDAWLIAGTVLILGGVALVNSQRGQRRLFGRAAPAPATASPTRAATGATTPAAKP